MKIDKEFLHDYTTVVLDKDLEKLQFYTRKVDFFKDNIKSDEQSFWMLLFTGITLFIPGLFLWYFKVQKPQDRLLAIQLFEAENLSGKKIQNKRKHIEPNRKTRS